MDLEKEITKLEKYLLKNGRENLVKELRGLSNEQRRDRMKSQAILEQELTDLKAKAADKDPVKTARGVIQEHNRTYSEQKRMSQKISRFVHLLIEDSGKV